MRTTVTQRQFEDMLTGLGITGWGFSPHYCKPGSFKVSHGDSDELEKFEGIPLKLLLALGALFKTSNVNVVTEYTAEFYDCPAFASIWIEVGP